MCIELDNKIEYIQKITFSISRSAVDYTHTILFEKLVTEKKAVLEVEKWLSVIITEEYFEKNKGYNCLEFNKYNGDVRGKLLSSGIFLEEIINIEDDHILINCGS